MKKALEDLGIDKNELRDPPMNKKNYLDKLKKQKKHETEINEAFEKKFGIKNAKEESEIELKQKKYEIEDELNKITEEEKRILNHTKISYDDSVDYEEPTEENYVEHAQETYNRLKSRLEEMKEKGIINIDEKEVENEEIERMAEHDREQEETLKIKNEMDHVSNFRDP
jgi:hypothetical protein